MKFKNDEINALKSEVESLHEKSNLLFSDIVCLHRAKGILTINDVESTELNNLIHKLENCFDLIEDEKKQKETEIEEIQNKCGHNLIGYGHDSHHDYYICDICGKVERY